MKVAVPLGVETTLVNIRNTVCVLASYLPTHYFAYPVSSLHYFIRLPPITVCKERKKIEIEIFFKIIYTKFSEQPALIWEVVPPYIVYGKHYFANYVDVKIKQLSPYKLYRKQPPRIM